MVKAALHAGGFARRKKYPRLEGGRADIPARPSSSRPFEADLERFVHAILRA